MLNKAQLNIGFLAGFVFTFSIIALIEFSVLKQTGGIFIYPVDDTFIHLELSKNLAEHGVWGINSTEFSSASSSLLYTLLLGLLSKIFSSGTLLPFIINVLAGIALIYVINQWLARQRLSAKAIVLINALVVFFTPLPVIIISGMEHTLQCLFSFLLLFSAGQWLENKEEDGTKKFPWAISIYAMLTVATRYEGLFLAGLIFLAFLFYRRFREGIIMMFFALLPVLIFGLYSLSKGSFFLPNSVLIKSNEVPLFGGGIGHFFETLFVEKLTLSKPGITAMATQRLLLLLPVSLLLFFKQVRTKNSYTVILLVLTFCVLAHLALASTGKFYRYEAYLILCSTVIISTVIIKSFKDFFGAKLNAVWLAGAVLFFFLCLPVILRSTAAYSKASRACINIYQQQYQMGQFLKTYYPDTAVAANDIGAVAYFTKGTVVDLWGLGSIEVSRSRRGGYWSPQFLDSLCKQKNVKLALIYDSWFNNGFRDKWKKVASWQIFNNVVCGDDFVSFYAVDSTIAPQLLNNLKAYQSRLPKEVAVQYY